MASQVSEWHSSFGPARPNELCKVYGKIDFFFKAQIQSKQSKKNGKDLKPLSDFIAVCVFTSCLGDQMVSVDNIINNDTDLGSSKMWGFFVSNSSKPQICLVERFCSFPVTLTTQVVRTILKEVRWKSFKTWQKVKPFSTLS